MLYRGSCHCGKVAYEFEGQIEWALSCNCSICSKKGSLLWFEPAAKFRLLTADDEAGTYLFNKHVIRHRFCRTCGVTPYAQGVDPKGQAVAAINIRCLDGFDFTSVPVKPFDGRSL